MSQSIRIEIPAGQTGLTWTAQLIDPDGDNVGSTISSGFTANGTGYIWTYASVPDDFTTGSVLFVANSGLSYAADIVQVDESVSTGSITFTRNIQIGGVDTDADSDPTIQILRLDTSTVVVATTSAGIDHPSTGNYSYSLSSPVEGVTYRATWTFIINGQTFTSVKETSGNEAVDGTNLVISPILVTNNNPRYTVRDLAPVPQASAPSELFIILDSDKEPVNLFGASLRFVAAKVTDAGDTDDDTDDQLQALYEYELNDGLSLGGTDQNQITLTHSEENTATPGHYRYFLWNMSDKTLLARGGFIVEPAVSSV